MTGYVITGEAVDPHETVLFGAAGALRHAAETSPDAGVGVIDDVGRRFTPYPEFLTAAARWHGGLAAAGVARGATVILQLSDIHDHLMAVWACLLGGIRPVVVTVPADPARVPGHLERLRHVWELMERPAILTDSAAAAMIGTRLDEARLLSLETLEQAAGDLEAPAPVATTGPVMYLLSSGSTGAPKVIELTDRGLIELALGARDQLGVEPGHATFNWMPLDHSGAFLLYHVAAVFLGATNWHAPTEWILREPLRWLRTVGELGVEHSWAPNFAYRLVAGAASVESGIDLSRVRTLVSGGEQILESVVADFLTATAPSGMTPDRFRPCWGMTETTTAIAFGRYDHPAAVVDVDGRRLVSIGEPSPGAAMRVVGTDGEVLPERTVGALQIRSARVTSGYVGRSEPVTGPDGWFDTGDLAYLADGRLTITGRAKDIIILNGDNHDCHHIEQVVATVPGVVAGLVGAVGVPAVERGSETLGLALVVDPVGLAEPAAPARIARRVARVVSDVLGLSAGIIAVVPESRFPRTGSGKIQRAVIARHLLDGEWTDARASAPTAAPSRHRLLTEVLATCRRVLGYELAADRPLYEQGVDSVRIPQLAEQLSHVVGRPITTTMLLRHPHIEAFVTSLTTLNDTTATPRSAPPPDRRVAIIGMAARFPGADSIEEFWENLCAGRESLRRFTPAELSAAGIAESEYRDPRYVPVSGTLGSGDPEVIGDFDAGLFGISAAEADYLDPQQRLFLEQCHQALESAGYAGTGTERIGLYAGCGMNLYAGRDYRAQASVSDPFTAMQVALGTQPDFLATRVAYRLGLTGPAVTVQTACSTALVAVHHAVGALLAGDADIMIAGASSLHVPATIGYHHVEGTMMSPTGRCRSFDEAADGTVGGNGVACVVLKRLDHAIADGDTIHAVIAGSAVNNDGASKVGFTAPSVSGQVEAITAALDAAGVTADDIGYVEAHGTGTQLGDPLEVQALTEAFAARPGDVTRDRRHALGSVKANIGHLDACAGMAGLIKAVLILRHGRIPPQINFDRWNPAIDPGPFQVHTAAVDWPVEDRPRHASVQALGVGGTNAHLVVAQGPTLDHEPPAGTGGVVLSAHTPQALTELTDRFLDRLDRPEPIEPADILATTALGRRHRPHRLVAFGDTPELLAERLRTDPITGSADTGTTIGFVFSGQGRVTAGAARRLHDTSRVFRDHVDRCVTAIEAELPGFGIADALLTESDTPLPTALVQPALFTLQTGLTALWAELGIRPDHLAGHSVGEYAAWCAAGAFTVEDGARMTAVRGELMAHRSPPGAMLAVRAGRRTVDAAQTVIEGLDLAVVNADQEYVLAGSVEAVEAAADLLDGRSRAVIRLPVHRAFHSRLLDPMLPEFGARLDQVDFTPTTLPVISSRDGRVRQAGFRCDGDYLTNHAREVVRWDLVVRRLADLNCGHVVELGTGTVLTGIGRRGAPQLNWLATDPADIHPAAARLYCDGHSIDWRPLVAGRRVPLPTHPFDRTRHWIPITPPTTA
ncbi:acyl transferase domain-containing protein [Stackebrandtia endophytica]|uniref:Acyl transferase domain-containing protein n=1 Tax=Stackebrandtia endophytica TaxID=1496996 RepID=A0A543B2K2_9ACTN|nr:type I polyketide synthase [Stackebrandtia endophytica]TQL78970.1 acyl transferase domain-containing protein [Stackebrandtia endophytica]